MYRYLECIIKKHMPAPTVDDFKSVANEFFTQWNFPNCVESVDGKHIGIKYPHNSGSMFYNYNQHFSIVLIAVADANSKYLMIDVGKDSDGSVLRNTAFYKRLEHGTLKSLSRARMTVKCAFGIASSKFRILLKAIETKVENADHIVKAICILNNVIIDKKKEISSCQNHCLNKSVREKNNAMLALHGCVDPITVLLVPQLM